MKLVKEVLKIDHIIGNDRVQSIVDDEAIVPDTKPDILKILQVDVKPILKTVSVFQDKVVTNINTKFEVLYVGEGKVEPIYSMTLYKELTEELNIPGIKQDMNAKCCINVEDVKFDIVNPRKLRVKAILVLSATVEDMEEVEVVTDVDKNDDVQLKKEKIKLNSNVSNIVAPMVIKENVELPGGYPFINNMLKSQAVISNRNVEFQQDQLRCKGILKLSLMYVSQPPEAKIEFLEQDMPFDEVVEVPNVTTDTQGFVDFDVDDLAITVNEDEDGDKNDLDVVASIKVKLSIYNAVDKDIVVDAYSTNSKLLLKNKDVKLSKYIGEKSIQSGIKESVGIPDNMPNVIKIFDVEVTPLITDKVISEGKVTVEGLLKFNMLYNSDDPDRPILNLHKEIPIRQNFEIEGIKEDSQLDVWLETAHKGYTITSTREVEFRVTLNINAVDYEYYNKNLIVGIEPGEKLKDDEDRISSIVVYVVQNGEDLWHIAKRFNTTIGQLVSVNNIEDPDKLNPGQKIYIFRTPR